MTGDWPLGVPAWKKFVAVAQKKDAGPWYVKVSMEEEFGKGRI